jgi:hypothetical protein
MLIVSLFINITGRLNLCYIIGLFSIKKTGNGFCLFGRPHATVPTNTRYTRKCGTATDKMEKDTVPTRLN